MIPGSHRTLSNHLTYPCMRTRLPSPSTVLALFAALLLVQPTVAQDVTPTRVVVRAVAQDAKIIQDPVGGALVTIRNAKTGEVLAEGRQTGDSGSTQKIMGQPHERGASVYEAPGAAKFETLLQLRKPTRVRISATGPLDYPQAEQTTSKTVLLVPGQDVTGDGIILPLHGFIVEVLQPETAEASPGTELSVRARVRMLCGCPTEPGGMWDSSRYTIRAQLIHDGDVVAEAPLSFTGTTNEYSGSLQVPSEGATTLRVTASDEDRVNFGMATKELGESER